MGYLSIEEVSQYRANLHRLKELGLFGGEEVGWGGELQVFKAISVKTLAEPCPVWLGWLGIIPQSERSLVQFSVKAHAWVVGSASSWGTCSV